MIDVVVASALMLLVFVGMFAAFQLSVDVMTNNKARAGAIALANERMEYVHSLAYSAIGTISGVPAGSIAQSEAVTMNAVPYTRRTTILYGDDPGDGSGSADNNHIPEDYKIVRVDVSWNSRQGARHVTLVTRIEPPNGMEIACVSCGTLAISVRDASSHAVSNARVHIVNASTSPAIDLTAFANEDGDVAVVGAPVATGYKISATKTGYSTDQTQDVTAQNPNPVPRHLTVTNGNNTSIVFAIDVLATKSVYTWTQKLSGVWSDPLDNNSLVATSTSISLIGGEAKLMGSPGSYPSSGVLQSVAIGPSSLAQWSVLSWAGATSSAARVTARVYDGSGQALIPDTMLPGNSIGTTSNSIDISGIATSTYPSIRVGFELASIDHVNTPTLGSYSVGYQYGPLPLHNIPFVLQGSKTIGINPVVYKYQQSFSTSAAGSIVIPSLEWDTYTVSVPASSGYDMASSCGVQPELLSPGVTVRTDVYLATHTTNSLLIDVSSAGVPIPGASVRIGNGAYTATATTDRCGQAFFSGLAAITYDVQVIASGHASYMGTRAVSGTTRASLSIN